MATQVQIVFDVADPHAQVRFWAGALGYEEEDHGGVVDELVSSGRLADDEVVDVGGRHGFRDVAACRDPQGVGPRLFFQRVPEPKTVKNRVHLDLQVGPERAPSEVERLVGLGARVVRTTSDRGPVTTTLQDPEGNELCVS